MATTLAPSPAARAAKTLTAALIVAALVIGVPVLLIAVAGVPWEWRPDWTRVQINLHWPPTNTALRYGLAAAGWIVWLWLVARLAWELLALAIGHEGTGVRVGPVRLLAAALVGTGTTAMTALSATAAPAETVVTAPIDATSTEVKAPAVNSEGRQGTTATDHSSAKTMHTVKRGETLWSIADRYWGDPARYPEIFRTNQGQPQSDGRALADPGIIYPGWQLTIPTTTPDAAEQDPETAKTVHIVGPGDSLWSLAEHYLGDGERYTEILEANRHKTFPGGRQLTDPDLIIDGWQLDIPAGKREDSKEPTDEQAEPGGDGLDDSVVPDPSKAPEPSPAAPESPQTNTLVPEPTGSDGLTSERADSPIGNVGNLVPLGVWISAGTCLGGATVIALAAKLRTRRRTSTKADITPANDEPLTGRLSDLEAVIEAEARKLTEQLPTPDEEPAAATIAVDAELTPIELTDLAEKGIGLLGPGQRGAALAAILTEAASDTSLRLTQAAVTRLGLEDLDSARLEVFDQLPDALGAPEHDTEVLLVCSDTDADGRGQAMLEQFLATEPHRAVIIGAWETSAITLNGDGTVRDVTGAAAQHSPLTVHIADPQTATAVLTGLDDPDTQPISGGQETYEPAVLPANSAADHAREATKPVEDETEPRLRLCLFGQPDVYLDHQAIPLKKGRRSRAFLTILACADGPVSRDELLEGVVGDMVEIERAKNNFSATAIDTRRALREATGDPVAEFYTYDRATESYELERDRFSIDIDEFNDAEQAAALTPDPANTARHLEDAIALYTGDLAPDVDTDTVNRLRGQYRTAAARVCGKLADYYIDIGDEVRAEHHRAHAAKLESSGSSRPGSLIPLASWSCPVDEASEARLRSTGSTPRASNRSVRSLEQIPQPPAQSRRLFSLASRTSQSLIRRCPYPWSWRSVWASPALWSWISSATIWRSRSASYLVISRATSGSSVSKGACSRRISPSRTKTLYSTSPLLM